MDTNIIQKGVDKLTTNTPQDDFFDLWDKIEFAMKFLKDLRERSEQIAIEKIREQGDMVMARPDGTEVRYYIGTKKTWRCADKKRAIELALQLGETEDDVAGLLTSDPVKRGAITKRASEAGIDVAGVWLCEESDTLEEGKPDKKLKKLDTRFIN